MQDYYCYVAVLEHGEDSIGVYFPDILGCISGGDNINEAIESANEALKLHLYSMEKDNDIIPKPSLITDLKLDENEVPILINVFMKPFREKMDEKYVKKTLSIPNWMNTIAEEKGINFSKTLQEALAIKLELPPPNSPR